MKRAFRFGILSLAAVVVASCGGGGSPAGTTTTTTGGLQTTQLGIAQVSFTSKPSSVVGVTGQSVSIYGMAGTTFPDVIVEPPPTLDNTAILFTNSSLPGLWTYANGQVNPVGGTGLNLAYNGDWTHDGHIIYVAYDKLSALYQIFECNYDGSGSHRLTNSKNVTQFTRAVWSPLNNLIAFDDGENDTYIISTTGTNETTRIDSGIAPCFSPDGQTIAFADNNNNTVSTIPVGGGAITEFGEVGMDSNYTYPNYSPEGNFLAFTDSPEGENTQVELFTRSNFSAGFYNPPGTSTYACTFSPDGTQVAYLEGSPTATHSLVTASYSGYNMNVVVPSVGGMNPASPSWSPFPGLQRFVAGTAGTVLTNPSGFLFAQAGDKFGGFVAFTAKTPADATITSEGTPTGTAPYSFDIHADEVTSMKYTNGLYSAVNTVSTGSYSDVLVSVSGVTGQISYIAPVLQKRPGGVAQKPLTSQQSGNTVYSGAFAGLYDAKGKNWAPSGLTQFRLDPKGKLIDFK